jgi:asparagine synthase (glutamine-hydrolysing)
LDSSSVAALATGPGGTAPARCLAVTAVYERLLADQERCFSASAARALGLAIQQVPLDDYDAFARWDGDAGPVEPSTEVLSAVMLDLLAVAKQHAGVVLTGDGGDPLLLPGAVVRHVGRVPALELGGGVWRTLRRGLWPPLGLRSGSRRWARAGRVSMPPPWIADRLRRGSDLAARCARAYQRRAPWPEPRGESLSLLASSIWAQTFEAADPNSTALPVELRYPFFDARLVSLALSLPSYPWCISKTVLREAMAGWLPDVIRLRPKTPLAGDVLALRDEGLLTDRQPGTLAAAALAMWLNTAAGRTASV